MSLPLMPGLPLDARHSQMWWPPWTPRPLVVWSSPATTTPRSTTAVISSAPRIQQYRVPWCYTWPQPYTHNSLHIVSKLVPFQQYSTVYIQYSIEIQERLEVDNKVLYCTLNWCGYDISLFLVSLSRFICVEVFEGLLEEIQIWSIV